MTFDYQVYDAFGEHDDGTVQVTLTGANDGPTLAVTTAAVTVNEAVTATNNGTFDDVDATDEMTLSASEGTVVIGDGLGGLRPAGTPKSFTVQRVENRNHHNGGPSKARPCRHAHRDDALTAHCRRRRRSGVKVHCLGRLRQQPLAIRLREEVQPVANQADRRLVRVLSLELVRRIARPHECFGPKASNRRRIIGARSS